MRIVAAAARTIRWPIAARGAARGRSERAAVIVEVRSERGAIGLGEAAPLAGMSSDTLEDAARAIEDFVAHGALSLADVRSDDWIDRRDPGDARAGATHSAATTGARQMIAAIAAPSARFAIETALLDAVAREHGKSLAALLGAPAERVPLAAVVEDADDARRAFAAGIRCLKLKLVATDDLSRVHAITAAAPGARLRIDANRTWPVGEVVARLTTLAALPVDYVEEPCASAHRLLSEALPCRIALDESLIELSHAQLDSALQSPSLAAIVLKPTLLGGLSAAMALAERARHTGVAAIASHGLEGPVGTAACAEFALALGSTAPAGLAAHTALDGWRVTVTQLARAHVQRVSTPGLGIDGVDLERLVQAAP